MNERNTKFLYLMNRLEIPMSPEIQEGQLDEVTILQSSMCWVFSFRFNHIVPASFYLQLLDKLQKQFVDTKTVEKIQVEMMYVNQEIRDDLLEEYYQYIYETLVSHQRRYQILETFNHRIENNEITFFVANDSDQKILEPFLKNLEKSFSKLSLSFVQVKALISLFETPIEKAIEMHHKKIEQQVREEQSMFDRISKEDPSDREKKGKRPPRAKSPINGDSVPIHSIPASEVQLIEYTQKHGSDQFVIEGDLIQGEIRILKEYKLYEGHITDGTDSIIIKTFLNNNHENLEEFYRIHGKPGNRFKLFGSVKYDQYAKDIVFNIRDSIHLGKTKQFKATDHAEAKRIELHAHTKMSTQDGIMDVEEYALRASDYGHHAIAVTDHNTLQALPDLEVYCAKYDVQPIFGIEGSFVREEDLVIALTELEIDQDLDQATFIVYDVETTGLSSNFDEIIEIAAVKVHHGRIVEEFSSFVKPEKSIPSYITGLTQITNDDVRHAPSIEMVLQRFKKFIGQGILVAHNATFDNSMLYANLKRFDLYGGPIPTIDTLQLARIRYSDKLKKFNLKAVAKYFDVELTQHHRAIYDTKATAAFFLKMLSDLRDVNIRTYNQINTLIDEESYKQYFPSHIVLLAKNRKGIINLNKIVSDSNTVHFFKEPRILKSFLDEHREGLLIGSACSNGEVFDAALNKDHDELVKLAEYYDYLEVQPPSFYMHLFEKSFYKFVDADSDDFDLEAFAIERDALSEDFLGHIQTTIQKIIDVGNQLSIPVVATGDVHHLIEDDLIFRQIFIDAPQVGGGRHPLDGVKNIPSQHFMNTEEMLNHFQFLGSDVAKKIVVTNTHIIASKIEPVSLFPNKLYAPSDDFMKEQGIPSFKDACKELTYQAAFNRYGNPLPKIIEDRIQKELSSIIGNNYASIYFISHLLVKHSQEAGYVVGSRGSVGSSLVATLMNITEVNALPPHYYCPSCHFLAMKLTDEEKRHYAPSQESQNFEDVLQSVGTGYDLPDEICPVCQERLLKDGCDIPFETFLGFKGDKVPDIDLNFSGEYQNKAHEFCRELFGVDHAFRAGTISTVADLTAYGYVKNYLERKKEEARRCEITRLSSKIIGVKRSTGQHPGGIVVVPKEVEYTDIIPVQFPSDNIESTWRTTHYDYHKFESNLLKLDILGHDDPTMIRHLMNFVEATPEKYPFNTVEEIPLSDSKVLALFSGVAPLGVDSVSIQEEIGTSGLPEFGTKLAKDLLIDIRPKTVSDLIKISGLSHGKGVWNGNARDYFFGSKEGMDPISFKELIGCRDDIMVYLLSKNMPAIEAFKIMENVRKGNGVPDAYEDMMLRHDIPKWYIDSCKMIEYMFPKAHAAAYVIMALRIGWFKVYRPLEYYAAYFSRRANAYDVDAMIGGYQRIKVRLNELDELIRTRKAKPKDQDLHGALTLALEMTARGYHFKPIDLDKSDWRDFLINSNGLYIPFKALDSLGENTAKSITDARAESPFSSKKDVLRRTKINSTLFERMNQMGILKRLPDNDQVGLKLSYE